MNTDRKLEAAAGAVTVFLTAAAFAISYNHLAHVAHVYGMGTVAGWAWPATVDGFIVAGELLVLRASLRQDRDTYAYFLVVTGSLGSVALNVAGVGSGMPVMNYVVAAVPPVAALLAFAALMRGIRARLMEQSGTEGHGDVSHPSVPWDTETYTVEREPAPETETVPPNMQVGTGGTGANTLPVPPAYRPSNTRIGIDTVPRDRLSQEQVMSLVEQAWSNGKTVRETARLVSRSPSTVHRRFKQLESTKES